MPHISSPGKTRRRLKVVCAVILGCIFYYELAFDADHEPVINNGLPIVLADDKIVETPFEELVRKSPLKALHVARDRLVRESRDYSCTFVKQELVGSSLTAEQEIEVKFRPEPYSVVMYWLRNEGLAKRVIYVKGKWVDEDATDPDLREQAVCMPGKGLNFFVKSIKQPIHGAMAKRTARRAIDEFGFRRALDLLIKYCDMAQIKNELTLEFRGETHFDGRPVWLVRRHLPYNGEGGVYPDRIADIFIDQQFHVPIAVYCYAKDDASPESLLGKYEYRGVRFDIGLTEKDFEPATYGM